MFGLIFLKFFIFKAFTRMSHHHILPDQMNLKLIHREPTLVNFQYLPMNNKDHVHTTKFLLKVYHTLTVPIALLFPKSPEP